VLKKEKDERFKKIMELQQKITYKKNLERLNKIYPMILDDTNFGHTEFQCPEIDGKTYISQPICSQIISVKPKKLFNPYDLFAEVVK